MPYVTVNGLTYWQAPTTPPPPVEPVAMRIQECTENVESVLALLTTALGGKP